MVLVWATTLESLMMLFFSHVLTDNPWIMFCLGKGYLTPLTLEIFYTLYVTTDETLGMDDIDQGSQVTLPRPPNEY